MALMPSSQIVESLGSRVEMLLTSAGPTTEAAQERLLEMGRNANLFSGITVLRIADGWVPFTALDEIAGYKRFEHRVESVAARLWSSRYIGYVLTGATVETQRVGQLSDAEMRRLLSQTDMLLVPGGNTYQTMRGLLPHKEAIKKMVGAGMPYIGESAGTIVAGQTTKPASLEPADARPLSPGNALDGALGLLNIDITTHAAGRTEVFALPGIQARAASNLLRSYETPTEKVQEFAEQRVRENGTEVLALNDAQSLSVSGSLVTIL
jgi:peptidase E